MNCCEKGYWTKRFNSKKHIKFPQLLYVRSKNDRLFLDFVDRFNVSILRAIIVSFYLMNRRLPGAAELVQKVIDEEQVHKNGWSCSFLNEMTRCLSEYPDEECQIFIRGFISYLKSDELNRRDQFKLTQLLTFMTMKKIENLNRAVCDMKTEINEFKDGLVDGSLAPQIKTYLNNILKATSIHDSIECMPRGTMTILAS